MRTRLIRALASAVALSLAPLQATANEAKVIEVEGAPLRIDGFSSTFRPGGGSFSSRDTVSHNIILQNVSDRKIVAYGLGLHLFDVFDEAMGRGLNGISVETIEPNGTTRGQWNDDPVSAFKFKDYGTSVAYVRQVRFDDGTVWKADLSQVLNELQEFESSLTMDAIDPGLPD